MPDEHDHLSLDIRFALSYGPVSEATRKFVRGLCPSYRGDRHFRQRIDALMEQFRRELPAVLKEADKFAAELTASVAAR